MSDNAFINLHEQMQSKGWIPDWEFNEAVDLNKYNNCLSIADCQSIDGGDYKSDIVNGAWIYHLGKLTNGQNMFYQSTIASFSGDLSSLNVGRQMFYNTTLASFSSDLPNLSDGFAMFRNTPLISWDIDLSKLINGQSMFRKTALTSFSGNLAKLMSGYWMFYGSALESFNSDLSNLTDGFAMFFNSALETFNGDLSKMTNGQSMFRNSALTSFNNDMSKLTNGQYMFCDTHARTYNISHYKMENGVKSLVETPVAATGLKSFNSNLSSLTTGYQMFGNSTKNASPLNEESIMIIADTIQDINGLELTGDYDGQLWLGYDTSITDTTNIMNCCNQIANKGWKVFLNGAAQVSKNGVIETISLTNEDGSAIPYYYKPVQVTEEDNAQFVDGDKNYYIIVGGQHVFGDDISTYGMFTSYEHAIEQISLDLGLTPCEKPAEEENL